MARDYDLQHSLEDKLGDIHSYPNYLAIKPEGWIDSLVFELGSFHSCGQAEAGVGIRVSSERGGGVLTLDDMLAIHDMISKHFKKISKKTKGIGLL